MDLRDRQHLFNGFGDGLARGFEMVVTPIVFAGIGYLIDQAAGIGPAATLGFLFFALIGTFVRTWYSYDAEMRAHDEAAAWRRGPEGRP